METSNIFEQAVKQKIRFEYKGSLSTEDLWDLSLLELDNLFKKLNAKLKLSKEESLLGPKESICVKTELQVAIVKRIVEVKLIEQNEKMDLAEKRAKKQTILKILAEKKNENLTKMSEGELERMLESL